MNMKENVKIRKIHLDTLIQVLVEMYDKGVDYIDIIGEVDDVQDTVAISFCSEYMSSDAKENFEDLPFIEVDIKSNPPSNEDDLNQLI